MFGQKQTQQRHLRGESSHQTINNINILTITSSASAQTPNCPGGGGCEGGGDKGEGDAGGGGTGGGGGAALLVMEKLYF